MLRNWRKVIALLSVFTLVCVYMPVSSAETVAIYHETFASGIGAAVQSGGASLTQVTGKVFEGNSDGTALYVNNRSHDYDAADFNFSALGMENGKTYSITVKGYVDADAVVPSGAQAWLQTISSYGWLGGVNFTTGAAFTLSGNYTVDTSKDTKIRIQSNAAGATVPFYIGDILVTGESTTVENQVYHETFASGTGAAVQSGSANLTKVTGKVFEGNADGNALYISNRANTWDAADFKFADMGLENGKTYTITIKGYVDSNVPVTTGAGAALQTDRTYAFLASANFVTGSAFTLTKEYTVNSTTDTAIRIQSNEAGKTVPFYIGDILITGQSGPVTVYHETFAGGTGAAVQSGGANLTKVAGKVFEGNADGNALYVSNRANTWDAADFKFTDLKMSNGKTYTITVKGYVDSDAPVTTGAGAALQTDRTYAFLASANFVAGSAFTLTKEYTVDSTTDTAIRIQSNEAGKTVPFYIGDILVTEKAATGSTRPPAIPFTTMTFEDQTKGDFSGRAGTETLTIANDANHTTGGAYSLKVEGRTSTWHGPSLHVEKYIDQGSEYKITAWVKLISPASSQLQLSTQVGNGSSANYVNLQAKTVSTSDGWVKYEGTYRYNNASSEYLTIYVESSNNATASFYIDDVSFVSIGSGTITIQDLTPIKDVYSSDFLIGNAISAEDLSGVRLELLKKHFNTATAGNAMKPDALQPTKGNFSFTAADTMVDKVRAEGLQMHGHVLVWHQQSPAWMNTTGSAVALGREEALANLRTHIQTVMNHFGDKVISWDVVNEAMNDNPANSSDWKASLRKTPWYNAIGDDYVEQAFLAAREVLDAHPGWNIRLYYNDYNEDNQNKSKAIYNMVKELNDRYAQTHPGKLLIDGLGMQAHYNLSTNPVNVQLSLERFLSLGVKISITELDIQAGSNSILPENLAKAQGYLYAQLMTIFKGHAADIERITLWGMDDGTSWRSASNPLLFDKNLQAKPAYYAVIDPDTFMDENAPETPANAKQSTAQYGTPVIDGAMDSIWNGAPALPVNQYQMAWQGAAGTAKVLWDDSSLYILFQVSDTELDKTSANPWEQDSVEVFVDENNGKTSFYQDDDGQYRVNYANETSFNPASIDDSFVSAATTSAGANYIVEMKIPFKTITPENNTKIGFDAQINDAKGGARQSAASWNDTTGNGYQDTSVYGVITLTGKAVSDPDTALVEAAVLAIEGGTYQIPLASQINQTAKTAWVQAAVNARITAGNGSTATVTYGSGYSVSVTKGLITRPAAITVTEEQPDPDIALVAAAVLAIEGGTYQIPLASQINQTAKTAWVQAAVNARITAGNGSTATVTYGSGYSVSVTKGLITRLATITVTEQAANTSGDSDSPGSSTPAPAPAPTPALPASTIAMQPVLSGSTGTIKLDDAKAKDLLAKDTTIIVPAIAGATAYSVGLPVTALTGAQGGGTLTVSTNAGKITIPDNMLTGITGISGKEAGVTIGQGNKADLPADVKAALGNRPLVQLSLSVDGKQTEWNNPNASVSVSIPYTPTQEELKNPENIVVWYIDGSGNAVTVPNGRYDAKTGMVTFDTNHFSLYAVAFVQRSFSDLGSVAWAKKSIEVLAAKDIIKTPSANTYNPAANITRADFLYSLVRSLGVNTKISGNFDDVSKDAYYYNEIAIAKALGITAGIGNNKFGPDSGITRQDMMVMTEKALKLLKKVNQQGAATVLDKFTDRQSISSYAANSVATIVKEGLIVGSGNKINPTGSTTRAEAAVFLYRIYNKY